MHPDSLNILSSPEEVEALCQSCGACCAAFRVSFYWAETTAHPFGSVPEEMTERVNTARICMKGTNSSTPRCYALEGEIGRQVACRIYPLRSSTCREYTVFMADGSLNPRCNTARQKHGLPPLEARYREPAVNRWDVPAQPLYHDSVAPQDFVVSLSLNPSEGLSGDEKRQDISQEFTDKTPQGLLESCSNEDQEIHP